MDSTRLYHPILRGCVFFLAPFVFFDAPYYYAHTTLRYVQAAVETNLV